MTTINEGSLSFVFEEGWNATKLDEWAYFLNRFSSLGSNLRLPCNQCGAEIVCKHCSTRKSQGMKSVDFVMFGPAQDLWLLEVKDYRRFPRTKMIHLADEIAVKIRDSLAILLAASANADSRPEKEFARRAVRCPTLRIALHLEQPLKPSKLFPLAIDPANLQIRMRQLLRSIDPHPQIFGTSRPPTLWVVQDVST